MALKDTAKSKKKVKKSIATMDLSNRIGKGPETPQPKKSVKDLFSSFMSRGPATKSPDDMSKLGESTSGPTTPDSKDMGDRIPREPRNLRDQNIFHDPWYGDDRPKKPEGMTHPAFENQDAGPDDLEESIKYDEIAKSNLEKVLEPKVNKLGEQESPLETSINDEKRRDQETKKLGLDPQKSADVKSIMTKEAQGKTRGDLNAALKELNDMNTPGAGEQPGGDSLGVEGERDSGGRAPGLTDPEYAEKEVTKIDGEPIDVKGPDRKPQTEGDWRDTITDMMAAGKGWEFLIPAIAGKMDGSETGVTTGLATTAKMIAEDKTLNDKQKLEAIKAANAAALENLKSKNKMTQNKASSELRKGEKKSEYGLKGELEGTKSELGKESKEFEYDLKGDLEETKAGHGLTKQERKSKLDEMRDDRKGLMGHLNKMDQQERKHALDVLKEAKGDQYTVKMPNGKLMNMNRDRYDALPDNKKPEILQRPKGGSGMTPDEFDRREGVKKENRKEIIDYAGTGAGFKWMQDPNGDWKYVRTEKRRGGDLPEASDQKGGYGSKDTTQNIGGVQLSVPQEKALGTERVAYDKSVTPIKDSREKIFTSQSYLAADNAVADRGALMLWVRSFDSRISNLDAELYSRDTGFFGSLLSQAKETMNFRLDDTVMNNLAETIKIAQKDIQNRIDNKLKNAAIRAYENGVPIETAMKRIDGAAYTRRAKSVKGWRDLYTKEYAKLTPEQKKSGKYDKRVPKDLKLGTIVQGKMYLGGDPNKAENYYKVRK